MSNVRVMFILSMIFLYAASGHGAGFSIFEQGAAATGMAGAFTAHADDATAVFYNPAGITQLEGTHLSLGATFILPKADMQAYNPYTDEWMDKKYKADDQTFIPPNFYFTHKVSDRLSLGFGYGAPYGLGMKWDNNDDFPYAELVKEVNLHAHYLNPVVAVEFSERLAVALGLYYVISEVDYTRSLGLTNAGAESDGEVTLEGDNGSGDFGFNLGVHVRSEAFRLGLTYRSEVDCAYDGEADFTVPTGFEQLFPDQGGDTAITMPASASAGVAFFFSQSFSMEFDLNWMGWSSYDKLEIDFETETFHPATGDPLVADVTQLKDWDDVFSYRLGARFMATEALAIYAGYLFDESPIPDKTLDPILPDSDRQSFQLGAGLNLGNLKIDASYMALFFDDRGTKTNVYGVNARYENFAHLIGLQFSYAF